MCRYSNLLLHFSFLLSLVLSARVCGGTTPETSCRLLLCGSRGIGGVATISEEGVVSLDLLDTELEEGGDDEEEE
jgi:hypothetical protein